MKTLYALGLMLSRNLQAFELTPAELGFVMQGINDGASGKETVVKMEEYAPKVQALGQAKSDKRAAAEKAKSQAFLAAEAAKPGVVKSDDGRHGAVAALSGCLHEFTAATDETDAVLERDDARRHEGGVLAHGMSGREGRGGGSEAGGRTAFPPSLEHGP